MIAALTAKTFTLILLAGAIPGVPVEEAGAGAEPSASFQNPDKEPDDAAQQRWRIPTLEELSAECYEAAASQGDPMVCTRVLNTAAATSLDRAAALNNRALLFGHRRQLDLALADLNEAAALDPGSPAIAVNQGNLLLRLDRFQDAIAAYDAALTAAGTDYAPALYNRSFAHRAQGDLAAAEADLRAAARQRGGVLERLPEPAGDAAGSTQSVPLR